MDPSRLPTRIDFPAYQKMGRHASVRPQPGRRPNGNVRSPIHSVQPAILTMTNPIEEDQQ